MSAAPAESTTGIPYIRARAGGDVDARRVGRVLLALCALALIGVLIATTIGAANQNSVQTRLQRSGVPVTVTVTWCEGVGSGIGQGLVYDICRGSFTLGGHRYDEVIGGNRAVHPLGQQLRGVTVPGHPALLSTATAVAKKFSPWTPFITPIVIAAAAVVLALALLLWSRRRKRMISQPQGGPARLG